MLGAARKHTKVFVFVCAAPLSVLVRRPFEVMLSFPFNGFFHLPGQTGRRERAHQPEGVGPGQRCRAVQDQATHTTPQADERLLRPSCKFPQPLATVLVANEFFSSSRVCRCKSSDSASMAHQSTKMTHRLRSRWRKATLSKSISNRPAAESLIKLIHLDKAGVAGTEQQNYRLRWKPTSTTFHHRAPAGHPNLN